MKPEDIKTEFDNHIDLLDRYKDAHNYWSKYPDMFSRSEDRFLINVNKESRTFEVTDRQMSVFCEIVERVKNE